MFQRGDFVTIIQEPMLDLCYGWNSYMSAMCGNVYPIEKVYDDPISPMGKRYVVNSWSFSEDCFQEYYWHPETLTDDDYDLLLTEVSV